MSDLQDEGDQPPGVGVRTRIMKAAAELISEGGSEAATTRAVAAAAAVQAPTIYRLFGDKRGLLDAVAEQAFAGYVAGKTRDAPEPDPLMDLRRGWDGHVAFGLEHPAIFKLMVGASPGEASPAVTAGLAVLRERVRRVARSGQLRVSEERAVDLIHAIGTGAVLTLLEKPPKARAAFAEAAWETVLSAIIAERESSAGSGTAAMASGLRSSLDEIAVLTTGEKALLAELLQRLADAG